MKHLKIAGFVFLFITALVHEGTASKSVMLSAVHQDIYALLIGISDYKDETIPDLDYTFNDIILLGTTLVESLGVAPDLMKVLVDSAASKVNIENQLHRLAEHTTPSDLVIIYFSGHGAVGKDRDGDESDGTDEYILPWDTQRGKLYTAISDDMLGYLLSMITAKTILIFDSCYSGGAAKGVRGFSMAKSNTRATNKDSLLRDVSRENIAVLTASKPEELAQESARLGKGNGLFTYFLCKGLQEKKENQNTRLTIEDWYKDINNKVNRWTYANEMPKQTPSYINKLGKGFLLPLSSTTKKAKWRYKESQKTIAQPAQQKKILVNDGYYKTVRVGGKWKSTGQYGGMVFVPGEEKKIWVEPEYQYIEIPAVYKDQPTGEIVFYTID